MNKKKTKSRKSLRGRRRAQSVKTEVGTKWVSRIPGLVFPDSTVSKLIFYTSPILTNNGFTYANDRWKLNSAYDVDPTLGSTAVTGFSEASSVYSMYRVLHCNFKVQFTNQEAFPATLYLVLVGSFVGDPGANSSGSLDWMMNAYSRRQLCSQSGGMDRGTFQKSIDLAKLSGSTSYLTDDSFASLCTTNPATILYGVICADASGTNTFTTGKGFALSISYTFTVQFYGRKFLQT